MDQKLRESEREPAILPVPPAASLDPDWREKIQVARDARDNALAQREQEQTAVVRYRPIRAVR